MAVKAASASFTYDEAYSYLNYVPMDYTDIIAFKDPFTNNHILNTVGMKFFSSLFGDGEFALRLTNVLAFAGYAWAVFRILKRLRNKLLFLPSLLLLIANPFVLDFFSLARGYGLAVAMMCCSIERYLAYLDTGRDRTFAVSFVFAALAFMSNFATVYFFCALLVIHQAVFFFSGTRPPSFRSMVRHNYVALTALAIFGLIMYEAMRRALGLKIDFGGTSGFWEDTVLSLSIHSAYNQVSFVYYLLFILAGLVTFSLLVVWLVRIVKRARSFIGDEKYLFCVFMLLLLVFVLSELHHLVANGPFLRDRFALYLVPLFWLSVIFGADAIMGQGAKRAAALVTAALAGIMLWNTLHVLDTRSFVIWKFDQDDALFLERLDRERERRGLKEVQLGITWLYWPSFNYYKQHRKLTWLKDLYNDGLKQGDDFEYVIEADTVQVKDYRSGLILERFPASGTLFIGSSRYVRDNAP